MVMGDTDGEVAAVGTVSFVEAWRSSGRYAIIQEMFVEPESRSSGVGMAVLLSALEHAIYCGCSTVELGTPFAGQRQIQFYERAGFTGVGARLRWRP